MPTSFLSADAGFPRLTNDIPMEERMNRIQQYLYMLLEQLRYALSNLSEDNFNEADLKQLQEETVSGINSVVTDLEGNVSILRQTAEGLVSQVRDINGNISILEQTATSITSRLNDFNGSGSTIEQTAAGISHEVYDSDGAVSLARQTADKIYWLIDDSDPTTTSTTFLLTQHMAALMADQIQLYGTVTFNDLSNYNGTTIINGDNIELKADADGDSVSYLTYTSALGNTFAEIHTRDNRQGSTLSQDRYAFVIETPQQVDGGFVALKLVAGDAMSLEAAERIFVKADVQTIINNGTHATRIQANSVYYDPNDPLYPTDCYIFAADGIWYNGVRILSI